MRNRIAATLAVAVLCSILIGCALAPARQAVPAGPTPVQTTEKVAYIVPKDPAIVVKEEFQAYSYRGISLSGPSWSKGDQYENTQFNTFFIFRPQKKELEAFREKTWQIGARYRTRLAYIVDVATVERPDGFTMTLSPRDSRPVYMEGYMDPPGYPEADLLDHLSHGSVELKFEVDTADAPDAVYANFKRRLKGNDLRGSAESRKGTFELRKGPVVVDSLVIEVWPYKAGSKTVVKADVKLYPTENGGGVRTIDVKKIVDDARREIEDVVKG